MADTGFKAGSLTHLTYSTGTDIDGVLVDDNWDLTSDAVDLSGKYGRVYSVISVEDNTGACDGDVNVFVLASDLDPDGEGYQGYNDRPYAAAIIDQTQNATIRKSFTVLASHFPRHKIYVENMCGQQVAVTVNYVDITIPAAS